MVDQSIDNTTLRLVEIIEELNSQLKVHEEELEAYKSILKEFVYTYILHFNQTLEINKIPEFKYEKIQDELIKLELEFKQSKEVDLPMCKVILEKLTKLNTQIDYCRVYRLCNKLKNKVSLIMKKYKIERYKKEINKSIKSRKSISLASNSTFKYKITFDDGKIHTSLLQSSRTSHLYKYIHIKCCLSRESTYKEISEGEISILLRSTSIYFGIYHGNQKSPVINILSKFSKPKNFLSLIQKEVCAKKYYYCKNFEYIELEIYPRCNIIKKCIEERINQGNIKLE